MDSPGTAKKYHISGVMEFQSNDQLEQWAADPNCIEQAQCAAFLAKRKAVQASMSTGIEEKVQEQRASKRQEIAENPFDPRTEVSADAKHIANKVVMHLWILFVALPVVLALLYTLLSH